MDTTTPDSPPTAAAPVDVGGAAVARARNYGHADAELLESTLITLQSLIERAVNRHRRQGTDDADSALVSSHDTSVARHFLATALVEARSLVSILLPYEPRAAEGVLEVLDHSTAQGRPGVRIRLLVPESALTPERVGQYVQDKPWIDTRVCGTPLPSLVIVDRECAVAGASRRDRSWHVSMVRDLAVVQILHEWCRVIWRAAAPFGVDAVGDSVVGRADLREVVHHLVCGHTDDVAAREMSVSVRTYRRYVAEVMRSLGAESRFQAGVRASELGLTRTVERSPVDPLPGWR